MRIAPLLFMVACASSPDAGRGDDGTELFPPDAHEVVTAILDDLQPGWMVTTTRFSELRSELGPIETSQISDGTPLSLSGSSGDEFVAVVTDATGAVVEIRSMTSPCTFATGHRLDVPSAYATIQEAINAAQPGDTVKVAAGTYIESLQLRPGVCLLGSGASRTTIASDGSTLSVVNMTKAPGSVIAGFTVSGQRHTTQPQCRFDPTACSGNWYPAGVHIEGLAWNDSTRDAPPLIFNNIFTDNDIGVLLNWRAKATVRSNIFVGNTHGLVANNFADSRATVINNVFYANTETAIVNQAAYLAIVNNVIAESKVAIRYEFIQTGWTRCNLFADNQAVVDDDGLPGRFTIGQGGNLVVSSPLVDPAHGDFHLRPGAGQDLGCFASTARDSDGSPQDVGAFGGALSSWLE